MCLVQWLEGASCLAPHCADGETEASDMPKVSQPVWVGVRLVLLRPLAWDLSGQRGRDRCGGA